MTRRNRLCCVSYAIILAGSLSACSTSPVKLDVAAAPAIVDVETDTLALAPASSFEIMRAALPGYTLQESKEGDSLHSVTVVQDLPFEPHSTILGRPEAERLRPFVAYLVAHPAVTVQIEAYGNGIEPKRDAEMGLTRAHAVARVLQTDLRVANRILTTAGPRQHASTAHNTAIITVKIP